jgi:hypothetical protein
MFNKKRTRVLLKGIAPDVEWPRGIYGVPAWIDPETIAGLIFGIRGSRVSPVGAGYKGSTGWSQSLEVTP